MRSAHDSEKVEVEGSIPLVPTIFYMGNGAVHSTSILRKPGEQGLET